MNLLNKTILSKNTLVHASRFGKVYIYLIFIVLHIFLFNINISEWGDSYKILRASEYIQDGSYPEDEKRPPLFSIILSPRPDFINAVTWGRGVMFVFSLITLVVFDKLVSLHIKDERYQKIALIFFVLNPVYLYWSLRIMADVPFSFFVLLVFYLFSKWKEDMNIGKSMLIGAICGLAILTRFEGYLLFASALMGTVFLGERLDFDDIRLKPILKNIFYSAKFLVPLGLTTLLVILPWITLRNPLTSEYFEESSRRVYDFKMIWTYFSSLFYLFGFTSALYFICKNFQIVLEFFERNIGITVFVVLELILILLWPSAVPRLFVSVIPFLIIPLALSMQEFERKNRKLSVSDVAIIVSLLIFYVITQYFLKLQFLIPIKIIFGVLIILQILILVLIYNNKYTLGVLVIIISMSLWSLSAIYIHKDIYKAIKYASTFVSSNLDGNIVYNDTANVANWYINYDKPRENLKGMYWDLSNRDSLDYSRLSNSDIDYVILTNESDAIFHHAMENLDHLKLIKNFRYNIGSREFFASVFEFDKD